MEVNPARFVGLFALFQNGRPSVPDADGLSDGHVQDSARRGLPLLRSQEPTGPPPSHLLSVDIYTVDTSNALHFKCEGSQREGAVGSFFRVVL